MGTMIDRIHKELTGDDIAETARTYCYVILTCRPSRLSYSAVRQDLIRNIHQ